MRILQLCCFTDLWNSKHEVISIDIKNGIDIFSLSDYIGREFDFIVAAPPCDQFTVANNRNWLYNPKPFIDIAKKCYSICINSYTSWLLEQPPGRIEKFIPELKNYRIGTWQSQLTTKKHIIYSNMLFIVNIGGGKLPIKRNKRIREAWQPDFVRDIENCFP